MVKNLNRRKFLFVNKKNLLLVLFLIILLFSIVNIYSQKKFYLDLLSYSVEKFSSSFQYEYKNLEVSGLINVEFTYLENKLKKYNDFSIFLLPLAKISKEIKENNWIKNINLTTNYKDTLFVAIEEYKPFGIYIYNNRKFFFDEFGKIIDEVGFKSKINNNLITYEGQSSNLQARLIINLLKNFNFINRFEVKKIILVNKRRWDIIIDDNIKLMLSEKNPEISLQNFIRLQKDLNEQEINKINLIDLRNIHKTLIKYKK